jgi:hypothetical protein
MEDNESADLLLRALAGPVEKRNMQQANKSFMVGREVDSRMAGVSYNYLYNASSKANRAIYSVKLYRFTAKDMP